MSAVLHRRALMVAAQRLVKSNEPDFADYKAVADALAQVLTDDLEIPCKLVIRVNAKDMDKVLGSAS